MVKDNEINKEDPMPFGYRSYRRCSVCNCMGALSCGGKNKGKMAGHVDTDCPKRNAPFKSFMPAFDQYNQPTVIPSARARAMLKKAQVAATDEVANHLKAGRSVTGRRNGIEVTVFPPLEFTLLR